MCHNMMNSNI